MDDIRPTDDSEDRPDRISRTGSLTDEEVTEFMGGPPGQPIREIIEELERKYLKGQP